MRCTDYIAYRRPRLPKSSGKRMGPIITLVPKKSAETAIGAIVRGYCLNAFIFL